MKYWKKNKEGGKNNKEAEKQGKRKQEEEQRRQEEQQRMMEEDLRRRQQEARERLQEEERKREEEKQKRKKREEDIIKNIPKIMEQTLREGECPVLFEGVNELEISNKCGHGLSKEAREQLTYSKCPMCQIPDAFHEDNTETHYTSQGKIKRVADNLSSLAERKGRRTGIFGQFADSIGLGGKKTRRRRRQNKKGKTKRATRKTKSKKSRKNKSAQVNKTNISIVIYIKLKSIIYIKMDKPKLFQLV